MWVLKKIDNILIYCFDKIVASIILMASFPFLVLVYIFLLIYYKNSPIFIQSRAGIYGKPFMLYKFKTMVDLYDHDGNLAQDDKRITKVGVFLRRFSIDEIPQLFNVLIGNMSLVGPRPLYLEYIALYSSVQAIRLNVLPGLTGWAQINGRNAISWEEKFALDSWYVKHRSFMLNITILFKTFWYLLKGYGISHPRNVTMPKFTGSGKN